MHQRANVDYLAIRRDMHHLALIYKIARDRQHVYQTSRMTRSGDATLLKVSKPNKNKLPEAPDYKGSKMWNALPPQARKESTNLPWIEILAQNLSNRAVPPSGTVMSEHPNSDLLKSTFSVPSLRLITIYS